MSKYPTRVRHPADPMGISMGDDHWPTPSKYTVMPETYVAIDRKKLTFIGTGEVRSLTALAKEQADMADVVIGPIESGRTYSCLVSTELADLYANFRGEPEDLEGVDYSSRIEIVKKAAKTLTPIPIPPELISGTLAPPVASYAHQTKKAKQPKEVVSKPAVASPRPKEGTATGRVWAIFDDLYDSGITDFKELRASGIQKGTAEGINPATIQVQYGKWKNTKLADKEVP